MPFIHSPRDISLVQDVSILHTTDIYFDPAFLPSFETQGKQSEIFRQEFETQYPQCTWQKGRLLPEECRLLQSNMWKEYFIL